jgi:osmotically inducible lipoprotein OsmB
MNMVRSILNRRIIAALLSLTLLLGAFVGTGYSVQRHRRHRHSKLKGALIGGGVGTVGGAVIGGKKGAAIGAGAGAGTGYLIQRHRNRRHRRRG